MPQKAAQKDASLQDDQEEPSIYINSNDIQLDPGDIFVLCSLSATGEETSFRSTDPYTASVDEQGVITARHPGECNIEITSGSLETAAHVTVNTPETGGSLSYSSHGSSGTSGSYETPERSSSSDASDNIGSGSSLSGQSSSGTAAANTSSSIISSKGLTLYPMHPFRINDISKDELDKAQINSSDRSIAYYDMGCIFPLRPGKASVTFALKNGLKKYNVHVIRPVIKLSKKKITIKKGKHRQIGYYISDGCLPEFKSSKHRLVSVDEEGMIYAKKPGKAVITVSCSGVTAKLKVCVKKNPAGK